MRLICDKVGTGKEQNGHHRTCDKGDGDRVADEVVDREVVLRVALRHITGGGAAKTEGREDGNVEEGGLDHAVLSELLYAKQSGDDDADNHCCALAHSTADNSPRGVTCNLVALYDTLKFGYNTHYGTVRVLYRAKI